MNKKNTEKLFKCFPKLFPKMTFGFGCSDGWFDIVYNLCSCIQDYIDNDNCKQIIVTQVKEKFGGLRFYTYGGDDYVRGMIWFAGSLSYNICERCGAKGKLRTCNWYKTLCDDCYEEEVKK